MTRHRFTQTLTALLLTLGLIALPATAFGTENPTEHTNPSSSGLLAGLWESALDQLELLWDDLLTVTTAAEEPDAGSVGSIMDPNG